MTQPQPASQFGASQNTAAAGSTVPTGSPTQVAPIPSEFAANQGIPVPGLGTPAGIEPSPVGRMRIAGMDSPPTPTPGEPRDIEAGLLQFMQSGESNPKVLIAMQRKLIKAGYLNPSDSSFMNGAVSAGDATYYAYARLLNDSIIDNTNYMTLLDRRIGAKTNTTGKAYWKVYQQQTGATPRNTTTTSTSVDLTSAPDARGIAANEFESLLGRNVTDSESAAFHGALNAYEQANPSTTTQTTHYDPVTGQTTLRDSSQSGGITSTGASQLADSSIIQAHGGEYAQAQGTQVYDLLASLLGGS